MLDRIIRQLAVNLKITEEENKSIIKYISINLNKDRSDYHIEFVDNQFVLNRWDEIEAILDRVFQD